MIQKTVIGYIQRIPIIREYDTISGKEVISWRADWDVDCDGIGGNPFHDPYFQPETRYKHKGKSLWAEKVPYTVVPPLVLAHTIGKCLGAQCTITNITNDMWCDTVVGDSGPLTKIGEGSPRSCELVGLDPNPNHGGSSNIIIECRLYVGIPALIDGEQYELQAA